jgi:phosphoribosylglycinamide formyltransferase-1
MLKIIIVASTSGSVFGKLLECEYFKNRIHYVVSDRQCAAIDLAKEHRIPYKVFDTQSAAQFSDFLDELVQLEGGDLLVSFYTKLFCGNLITNTQRKLINLHPSILPACPGMDGFGDTVKSGSKFIGSTIHFIDSGIDTGQPIIQSATPFDLSITLFENRHKIFIHQCKMLLQVVYWFENNRVIFHKYPNISIRDAKYSFSEFSPNLDFEQAIDFK